MEERLGEGFYDYKVFCFHGRVNLIQVTVDRYINRSRVFYNKNWDKQDFTISVQLYKGQVPKPDNLNQMIQIAEKLSNPFGLVRIDLLSDGKNCLVGEITHCHGQAHEPFIPLNSEKSFRAFSFVKRSNLMIFGLVKGFLSNQTFFSVLFFLIASILTIVSFQNFEPILVSLTFLFFGIFLIFF